MQPIDIDQLDSDAIQEIILEEMSFRDSRLGISPLTLLSSELASMTYIEKEHIDRAIADLTKFFHSATKEYFTYLSILIFRSEFSSPRYIKKGFKLWLESTADSTDSKLQRNRADIAVLLCSIGHKFSSDEMIRFRIFKKTAFWHWIKLLRYEKSYTEAIDTITQHILSHPNEFKALYGMLPNLCLEVGKEKMQNLRHRILPALSSVDANALNHWFNNNILTQIDQNLDVKRIFSDLKRPIFKYDLIPS